MVNHGETLKAAVLRLGDGLEITHKARMQVIGWRQGRRNPGALVQSNTSVLTRDILKE